MSKQYYVVTLEERQETHLSPKASSAAEALVLTREGLKHSAKTFGQAVATPLSTRKQEAQELLREAEARNKNRWKTYNQATWADRAAEAVAKACQELIKGEQGARADLLKRFNKPGEDLGDVLAWGVASEAIEWQVLAYVAQAVLRRIEKEKHPIDAVAGVLRWSARKLVQGRFEGSQHHWRAAVAASVRRGRQRAVSDLGSKFLYLLHEARACEQARAKLGLDAPPWEPINLAAINPELT